jgi:dipeptidyl aminopeptidase/acylaminoacyl peptidase
VWLAFGAGGAVHVVRADGSGLRPLALGMQAADPAFSPDGRSLAFAGPSGIWVRDLASGDNHQITSGQDGAPAWSPDGRLVAFTRDVDVYVVGADGMGERQFVHGPPPGQSWYSNYGHPAFTHDGASLLVGHRGGFDIGNIDGTGLQPLFVTNENEIVMVTVSPTSDALAVFSDCGLRVTPFASAASPCEGTSLFASYLVSRPAWSAGGLVAYRDGMYAVRAIPATGGTATTLVDTKQSLRGVYVDEVSWSPPGTVVP